MISTVKSDQGTKNVGKYEKLCVILPFMVMSLAWRVKAPATTVTREPRTMFPSMVNTQCISSIIDRITEVTLKSETFLM